MSWGAPVIVIDDEVGGAEGAMVVDVGQQRRIRGQLDHLRVALHACYECCLRDSPLESGHMHTSLQSVPWCTDPSSIADVECRQ